jgi:hypothetical protein
VPEQADTQCPRHSTALHVAFIFPKMRLGMAFAEAGVRDILFPLTWEYTRYSGGVVMVLGSRFSWIR